MAGRDDVEAVQRRLRQKVLERGAGGDAEALIESLTADGAWPDIAYEDTAPADWLPRAHLERMRVLARDYPSHARQALTGWLQRDPHSDNWWHNQLGTPIALGDTLVLIEGYLHDEQRALGAERLARAVWDGMTAQNLIWAAQAQIRRGVLLDDADILADAFERVKSTVRISTGDGVQPDFSFHQHGPLLYFAGYGHDFAVDAAEIAYLARDTAFRFSDEQLEILTGYLLDGSQWAVHGRATYDFAAAGRVIARPSTQDDARVLAAAAQQLAVAGSTRGEELLAFAARLDGDGAQAEGNRHFWRSDYQSHHRRGWSTSVKMCSVRIAPTETGNGEALRSWYLGEGINPVWVSGEEYRDLFPVWDWRRLPGLTAEQGTGELPVLNWDRAPDGSVIRGGRDFVGGVSDGRYGMAVMRLAKDNITDGWKAWFLFDDEFVALGAGIEAPQAPEPVHTTINQTRAAGNPPSYADSADEIAVGPGVVRDPRWAHHGQIGYVFPTATGTLRVEQATRSGSWHDISRPESTELLEQDIVTLGIDHGVRPRGAHYAYVVVPGIDRAQTVEYSANCPVSIIANTVAVQAVRHDLLGITQVAFHRPGRLAVATRQTIAVDQPVLLQLAEEPDGLALSVANPYNERLRVTVDVGTRIALDLPDGERAGQTVRRKLNW